jgi:hypothetical protein
MEMGSTKERDGGENRGQGKRHQWKNNVGKKGVTTDGFVEVYRVFKGYLSE